MTLVKLCVWVEILVAIEYHGIARAVSIAVLLCFAVAWVRAQGQVMPYRVAHCGEPLKLDVGKNGTPFVVLATQRTGSNMVCGLLHGVRDVRMHNELFNEKGVFSHCMPKDERSIFSRQSAPRAFLLKALSVGAN